MHLSESGGQIRIVTDHLADVSGQVEDLWHWHRQNHTVERFGIAVLKIQYIDELVKKGFIFNNKCEPKYSWIEN